VKKGQWNDPKPAQVNVHLPDSGSSNHPIAIAAVAVASTIGLMLLLFNEIILPVRTDDLEKELGSLNSEVIKLRSDVSDKESRIQSLRLELRTVRDQFYELQNISLFSKNNPFPQGLRDVRPGTSSKQIEKAFQSGQIEKTDNRYWVVNLKHSTFKSATYYLEKVNGNHFVSHISYSLRSDQDFGNDFLQNKLEEALGTPRSWKLDGYYSWQTKRRAVYKNDAESFIVMDKGHILALWPSE